MITLPAGQVAAGQMPPICPRHGEQPVEQKRLRLISKPPPWAPFLIILGGIVYVIVVTALRKKVEAPAWPWCAQCKQQRSKMLGIGWGVLGLGLLLFIVGIATADSNAGPLLMLVGIVALLVGIIFAARGGYQAVTSAFVSQDGNFVEIHKPDARFQQALQGGYGVPQQPGYPQQQRQY